MKEGALREKVVKLFECSLVDVVPVVLSLRVLNEPMAIAGRFSFDDDD